jgi:hypothetical protein
VPATATNHYRGSTSSLLAYGITKDTSVMTRRSRAAFI